MSRVPLFQVKNTSMEEETNKDDEFGAMQSMQQLAEVINIHLTFQCM